MDPGVVEGLVEGLSYGFRYLGPDSGRVEAVDGEVEVREGGVDAGLEVAVGGGGGGEEVEGQAFGTRGVL